MSAKFDFKSLDTGYEADWPVSVPVPIDGGTVEMRDFMARFRTLTKAEIEALEQAEKDRDADGEGAKALAWLETFKATIRLGFVGFGKGENETLTPELFDKLWGHPPTQGALIKAWRTFVQVSPAKN